MHSANGLKNARTKVMASFDVMDSILPLLEELGNLHLADKSVTELHKTEPNYVLDFAVQNRDTDPLVAVACSNFNIRLMSRNRLTPISTISGHKDTITKVQFGKTDANLVFSCSKDKTVRCWDTRASNSKEVQNFQTPPSAKVDILCLDVGHSDKLICAGTEMVNNNAYLFFWDTRQGTMLGCYSESHQDDVTQVSFQPESDQYLASGSADGLVCTFDLSDTAEEDALLVTSNAESDVARVGWCGTDGKDCVYCVTSDNSFQVWEALEGESYCSVKDFNNLDEEDESKFEYIIDCIPELTACGDKSSAVLLAGTHSGSMRIVSVTDKGLNTLSTLLDGHTATVRCSHWDMKNKTLLTGGEDSLLCLWSTESSSVFATGHDSKLKIRGKVKGKASVNGGSKKPYDKKKT